ncbi:phosphatidylinositol phosphate synthase [Acidipropionibacterium virtanenii]|uniref:Phosphatidylinositol phosphate synthase n=1 Tax=Acidipropionibacterium virtanenii TaxID=2057246 RepID=A0A344UUG8_9ACTN|nr:CDP-alcohol phosphatidyltransferase family protein [Acidipropionibacterium virtanenii]AXE38916.1 CDP-diacylglycerol--inositol 3-phosphatidyltransferase [Acidipropionibacterium virtanenii]
MLEHFRAGWSKAMHPLAAALIRMHVTPDMVTWAGTIGTVAMSLICFPRGWLWQGAWLVALFIFSDSLDGNMARQLGRHSEWGSFLDSTLDRFGDGAIFAGVALYYAGHGHSVLWAGIAMAAMTFGQITSYVRAKAESLGKEAKMGLATRSDRLLIVLVGVELTGLAEAGIFGHLFVWGLPVALCYLAFAGLFTVGQRMAAVSRQVLS